MGYNRDKDNLKKLAEDWNNIQL